MCTRFYIEKTNPTLQEIGEAAERSPLRDRFLKKTAVPLRKYGEIRPSDIVPVIAPDRNGRRAVFPMKWGFTLPGRSSLIVNARTETAAVKPTFAEAWQRRRCIIPASWYYEWEHFKTAGGKTAAGSKYSIQPAGSSVTWLCGIYRIEEDLPVFTVLTREPSPELAVIHDRMPLIMPDEAVNDWISPSCAPKDILHYALTDMVAEKADDGQPAAENAARGPYMPWLDR